MPPEPCGACTPATMAACHCRCHWLERCGIVQLSVGVFPDPSQRPATMVISTLRLWGQTALTIQSCN